MAPGTAKKSRITLGIAQHCSLGGPPALLASQSESQPSSGVKLHRLTEEIETISAITLRPWAALNSLRRARAPASFPLAAELERDPAVGLLRAPLHAPPSAP